MCTTTGTSSITSLPTLVATALRSRRHTAYLPHITGESILCHYCALNKRPSIAIIKNFFFFSSRRRHTRCSRDWSSDVCSSDLWNEAGFDDKNWKSVTVLPTPKAKLVAPAGPPVKAMEQITPVKVLKTPGGDTVLDMGQNMVGWIRFRLTAPAGTTITLRHAEVLDKAGNFYTANL